MHPAQCGKPEYSRTHPVVPRVAERPPQREGQQGEEDREEARCNDIGGGCSLLVVLVAPALCDPGGWAGTVQEWNVYRVIECYLRNLPVSRVYTRGMGDLKMRSHAPTLSHSTDMVVSKRARS